ncbi:hypothetical protein ScPMuIL_009270 [Solemya velum]
MAGQTAFLGRRVLLDGGKVEPACIVVEDGRIQNVIKSPNVADIRRQFSQVHDADDLLIMPGVVDSHVHVNEPGRTEWEGYVTATKAAAAGGITTIVDMPLNSIPPTTTLTNFNEKMKSARGKCYTDVAFWGGIVPNNETDLVPMLDAGIVGFKCFLIHSGVDEFPAVDRSDLEKAFAQLQGTGAVVLFHAELDCGSFEGPGDPGNYRTFLESRPEVMEIEAIKLVCGMCLKYRVRCHIVHLSAASALPLIREARRAGAPLTVETCHHYLCLDSARVPRGATQYKCCPPIRDQGNQGQLWEALRARDIDMVVSDHSPCIPELKNLQKGDFMEAWGGISSVQLGLSLFGPVLSIKAGYDADFVIWDPDATFEVTEEKILHRNKLTPYIGRKLKGVVHTTVLGGRVVYDQSSPSLPARGNFLFRSDDIKRQSGPTN